MDGKITPITRGITPLGSNEITTGGLLTTSPFATNTTNTMANGASFAEKANVIGGLASGIGGILGGIFGGGKRRREQRAAKQEYNQMMGDYKNFQFENAFANLENPYEDLTVNTQQAEFQSQQQQQGLANTLDALRQSGGGIGAAALAQSLVQQQSANLQAASASIGQQEAANARMAAQGTMQMQQMEAQGAMQIQNQEFGRTETMLGMAQQRKAAADQARQQATQGLLSGVGSIIGAGASIATGGGFGAFFGKG
jgi:hypothetical protein